MRRVDDDFEAPLVVGDDAVADLDVPTANASGQPPTAGVDPTWWVLVLGLALVVMAVVGLVMRPDSTPGTLDLGLPEASESVAGRSEPPFPGSTRSDGSAPAGSAVELANGPRQTVTTWSLPSGVWTWWPLGSHVVFVSAATDTSPPLVYAHDKVSGRAVWSLEVVEGAVMTITDPSSDHSVRFVVPGEPTTRSPEADVGQRDVQVDPLVVSVEDGSILSAPSED